jgi:hypothetical protein
VSELESSLSPKWCWVGDKHVMRGCTIGNMLHATSIICHVIHDSTPHGRGREIHAQFSRVIHPHAQHFNAGTDRADEKLRELVILYLSPHFFMLLVEGTCAGHGRGYGLSSGLGILSGHHRVVRGLESDKEVL